LIHHEIAIALTAVVLAALSWGQPNQIGLLTFLILWAMRLSAKLNLFLGAPHRGEELLPAHLAHLKSYFRHRAMNPLFPVSMLLGAALAVSLGTIAFALDAEPFEQAGFSLLLALTALALIEHAFLFLPPPNALLWGWATSATAKPRPSPRGEHLPTAVD
jgi:putative photosynthetic complex assembly protein 2